MQASESGYGFGLRVATDCRFEHDRGARRRLAGIRFVHAVAAGLRRRHVRDGDADLLGAVGADQPAWDVMLKTGGLRKRELPPTRAAVARCASTSSNLWKHWDDAEAKRIAAVNFFLDTPTAQRQAEIREAERGGRRVHDRRSGAAGELAARTVQDASAQKGTVGAFFTLAPTQPPTVQHLEFRKLASEDVRWAHRPARRPASPAPSRTASGRSPLAKAGVSP